MPPGRTSASRRGRARWCTPTSTTGEVLEALVNPETATRTLKRSGDFWDAVELAHNAGATGQGRRVAVLDSGFDLHLVRAAEPSARTRQRTDSGAAHGTVVARLVQTVAPDARLGVWDISRQSVPDIRLVGEALAEAVAWGADVVCCSFGVPSDAVMVPVSIAEPFFDESSEPHAVAAYLRERADAGFESFRPGGCIKKCAICDALDEYGDGRPLVVAAAGNESTLNLCPATHQASISAGFQSSSSVTLSDGSVDDYHQLPSFEQYFLTDMVFDEVPGFEGTSFAAPLLAGFAALVGSEELHGSVAAHSVLQLAIQRDWTLMQRDVAPTGILGTFEAYRVARSEFPGRHSGHGPDAGPLPCPLCALFFVQLWQNLSNLHLFLNDPQTAVVASGQGLEVAPHHPGLNANHAAALYEMALRQPPGSIRQSLMNEAARRWDVAAARTGTAGYRTMVGVAETDWNSPVLPTVGDTSGSGPQVRGPFIEAYWPGPAQDEFLSRAGRSLLDRGDLEHAERAYGEMERSDSPEARAEASLYLGVLLSLRDDVVAARHKYEASLAAEDKQVRMCGHYNLALLDEGEMRPEDARRHFRLVAEGEDEDGRLAGRAYLRLRAIEAQSQRDFKTGSGVVAEQ
jgi:tetratricopeptide (TPR) repeat protein